jgi:hypothetical protein
MTTIINQDEDSLQSETLYCICQKKPSEYSQDDFMIECDSCKDWLHGRYVVSISYTFEIRNFFKIILKNVFQRISNGVYYNYH